MPRVSRLGNEGTRPGPAISAQPGPSGRLILTIQSPSGIPRHSLSHQFLLNTTQELSQTTPGTFSCVTEHAESHSLHFGLRLA